MAPRSPPSQLAASWVRSGAASKPGTSSSSAAGASTASLSTSPTSTESNTMAQPSWTP